MTAGKISLCRHEPPYWLSNAEWSALKPYTHKNGLSKLYSELYIFVHIYICLFTYLCICITIIIKAKEAINLKMGGHERGSREGILERLEGGRRREKVI